MGREGRTVAVSAPALVVVAVAWLRLEQPVGSLGVRVRAPPARSRGCPPAAPLVARRRRRGRDRRGGADRGGSRPRPVAARPPGLGLRPLGCVLGPRNPLRERLRRLLQHPSPVRPSRALGDARARALGPLRLRARCDAARGGAEAGRGDARAPPGRRLAGNAPRTGRAGSPWARRSSAAALVLLAGLGSRRVPALALPAAVARGGGGRRGRLRDGRAPRPRALADLESRARRKRARRTWDSCGTRSTEASGSPGVRRLVLQVQSAEAPTYLRATVLDDFRDDAWTMAQPRPERLAGTCRPPGVRRTRPREIVTVDALADTHLVGGSIPMRFVAAGGAPLVRPEPGFASLDQNLPRGIPVHGLELHPAGRPRPRCAGRSRTIRRSWRTDGMLTVGDGVTSLPFGFPGRGPVMLGLVAREPDLSVPAARAPGGAGLTGRSPHAVRRGRGARAVVRLLGHLPLLEPPAGRRAAAGRVRHAYARRLLPVLRRRDGAHAPLSRDSCPGGGGLRRRNLRLEAARLERQRP